MEGVDYSHSRPNPQCLYDAGKRFVVRYVGPDTASGKWLREGEKDALRAAGLSIALVHETVAGAPLLGRAEGIEDALQGQSMAHGLGIVGRPIYFALDVDPRPLSSAQWDAVKAYCDGAASVIGRSRVGMYGGFKAIDVLVPTWAPWGWQTYAWSAIQVEGKSVTQWSPKAQLRQYLNGQDLCGGALDLCRSMTPDFGQWPMEDNDMTPDELAIAINTAGSPIRNAFRDLIEVILDNDAKTIAGVDSWEGYLASLLAAARAAGVPVDVDETAIAAAVVAALPPDLGDLTPEEIADAVKVALRQGTG